MEIRKIIEDIPTYALLRDAESFAAKTPTERGFEVSKVLQRGAMVCLASTIPLFTLRSHEVQMSYPLYDQPPSHSVEAKKHSPHPSPPKMDLSTLQDAVSGLGFVLDPLTPPQESDYTPLSHPVVAMRMPPSGVATPPLP